ncbi:hypothetical protein T440DRAFT_552191 [Plenodomus tracheiphilus IPT5]|uniref:Uncharacterized protein n=1 Tax=Plenodomus tracheiphilus IPT5 TaxID=1408161 RepID=A0A6A7BGE6_9PLEO|nr:hypothetical protein T440DRAFT_552191 [Plenodomus tracheiphilus IPT5]
MKSIKYKASQYFKDGPSQDEKAAIAEAADGDNEYDFDAGIQDQAVKKKASRFFLRKQDKFDKPLPAPPSNGSSLSVSSGQETILDHPRGNYIFEDETAGVVKPLPSPPAPLNLAKSSRPTSDIENTQPLISPSTADVPRSKSRASLAALKMKSSRFFRHSEYGSHSPPRPLSPQIPVWPTGSSPPRAVLAPLPATRGARSSIINSKGRTLSISRPMLLPQSQTSSMPKHPVTVPFTKPSGDPPRRPPRPDSIDEETLAFMRETGTRMVLPANHRISYSTVSASPPRSGISSVNSRLGFPDGYGTPRKQSLESPLAVLVPCNPMKPLPVRDSNGSIKYSRFSEYIKTQQDGYAEDGVDAGDREVGPIEQYDKSKEQDWVVVKRISRGPGDQPGMLFRDRWNGFHFVADV